MNKRKNSFSEKISLKKIKYIKNYNYIILIQSFFRKIISINKYNILFDKQSQLINKNITYNNNNTLLGDNIDKIDKLFFYKYKENNNYYFFDIRELYKHIKNKPTNPYTNKLFANRYIKQIIRIYTNLKNNGIKIKISNRIPVISRSNIYITNFIQKLNNYNIYTTIEQFNNLDLIDYLYIISTLIIYYESDYISSEIYNYFYNSSHLNCKLYTIDVIENIIYNNTNNTETIYMYIGNLIDSLTEE